MAGLRHHPAWEGLQALAHTLLYDAEIANSVTRDMLATITIPVVVLASDGSDPAMLQWAEDVADAVPHGSLQRLSGQWHGVPADTLATATLAAAQATRSGT